MISYKHSNTICYICIRFTGQVTPNLLLNNNFFFYPITPRIKIVIHSLTSYSKFEFQNKSPLILESIPGRGEDRKNARMKANVVMSIKYECLFWLITKLLKLLVTRKYFKESPDRYTQRSFKVGSKRKHQNTVSDPEIVLASR